MHEALGVPLLGRNGRIGWLGVFSRDPDVRFGDDDVRRLEELAERVAPAIENARRFREARQLADLDSLTGLHNRRYFYETLAREVDRAQRYQRRLSLVIVDVDGFKEINDRIGHLAGDAVLAEIADRIRQVVRSADIPCRVGGDEFAVIVPEVEVGQARQLVGRIQRAVSAQPIARAGRVRVSAGVADIQPNDSPTSLFERGDESLYAAKHAGKGGWPPRTSGHGWRSPGFATSSGPNSRTTRAGTPATIVYGGTSAVTTLPAPTIANSPTVTPARIVLRRPR